MSDKVWPNGYDSMTWPPVSPNSGKKEREEYERKYLNLGSNTKMYDIEEYENASKQGKINMLKNLINESFVNFNQATLLMEYSTKKSKNVRLFNTIFECMRNDIRKVNYYFNEVLNDIIEEDLMG